MYVEYRVGGSAPEGWADNFSKGGSIARTLAYARFKRSACWQEIRARITPGQRVLDAGCGTGEWVRFLSSEGIRSVGLDYSEELVARLKRDVPENEWTHGSVQSLPFPDSSMDGVISWGVIEHDESGPGAALREFYRVLKPGGWVFVTVPLDSPSHRRSSERQFGMRRRDREFFQYFFSETELADAVRDVGFDVERSFPCSFHYALTSPSLYLKLRSAPSIVQRIGNGAMQLYASTRADSYNMVLAVGQRSI